MNIPWAVSETGYTFGEEQFNKHTHKNFKTFLFDQKVHL